VICPKCHAEYVYGIAFCYDCGVDLVDALPPEPQSEPERRWSEGSLPQGANTGTFSLVTVYATPDPGLLAIAETMLDSAGIPHLVEGWVQQGSVGDWMPGIYAVLQPSLVRVAPQDADDAREVLADLIRGDEVGHS
jgi:hypothetical protein